MSRHPITPAQRVTAFFEKTRADESGCLLWIAGKNQYGYGRFWNGHDFSGAHRFAYELEHGPIQSGLVLMHACDVPACVNVKHLSPGTFKDNAHDAIRKGRMRRRFGVRHPDQSKLTEETALQARERCAAGEQIKSVAVSLGVSQGLISQLVAGLIWKHVGGPIRPRPRSTFGLRAKRLASIDPQCTWCLASPCAPFCDARKR